MDTIQRHHFETFAKANGIASSSEAFLAGWDACRRHYDGTVEQATAKPALVSEDAASAIYAAYPRHVGRADALKAIRNAIRPGTSRADYILERTKAFAAAVSHWPASERQFIPHPATWFNRGSYDDDPKEWHRGSISVGIRVSE